MPTDARILGPLRVRSETTECVVAEIISALPARASLRIAFANTHLLYHALKDSALARILAGFQMLNDGIGIDVLARLVCGRGFRANLNGTDLVPRLLEQAPPNTRLFLYGAQEHVLSAATEGIKRDYPHLQLCGCEHGYQDDSNLVEQVQQAAPDIVLVALGNPQQEQWINACAQQVPAGAYIAVGALFDFLSGARRRAPLFVRRVHLEWLFRLAIEPARLWRRYTIEIGYVGWALLSRRRVDLAPTT